MNRVFKVIWSAARGVFVVCGELANGYGKAPSCKMRTIARAALVIGLSFALLSGTSYQATAGDANEIRKDGAGYAKGGDVWEYIHKFMAFQDVYYPNPIYNSPYSTPTWSIGAVDRSPGSIIIGGASQQISSSNISRGSRISDRVHKLQQKGS